MTKRIALIGSAPSSVRLAPYSDPSWEIWGCSPGAYPHISPTRVNKWFELHRWEPHQPWFHPDYVKWMASLPTADVMMIEPIPQIPRSKAYPKQIVLDKFGPYFLNSSLSLMFALAILEGATEIGLWGVDMSAQEEWFFQRQGCQHFIDLAQRLGIKVTLPPESDLLAPPPIYGLSEVHPMAVKLLERERELKARLADAERRMQEAHQEAIFMKGALDDVAYMRVTWIHDTDQIAAVHALAQIPAERARINLMQAEAPATDAAEAVAPVKVPKKRGRKPKAKVIA
jgi:hypothetical protein